MCLRRTLDEESAREVEDPTAVRAAIKRHFSSERDARGRLAAAVDLAGHRVEDDIDSASALWLPMFETLDRNDSLFRRTVKAMPTGSASLVRRIGELLGPDSAKVLEWLRRAPLHGGLAAEVIDDAGAAVNNGGDAALSGLLAYTVWHAVHVLGL